MTRREFVQRGSLFVPAAGVVVPKIADATWFRKAPAAGGPSYVLDEGFGNTPPAGWTTTGTTPAPDFSETTIVHDGTYSLQLDSSTATCTAISPAFSTGADVYGRYWFYNDHIPSTDAIIFALRNGTTEIARIEQRAAGTLRAQATGGTAVATTLTTGEDAWIRIWFHFTQGSGTNATMRVWWATTDSHPGSGNANYFAQSTNGTSTLQCDVVRPYSQFIGTTNGSRYFDTIQISLSPLW